MIVGIYLDHAVVGLAPEDVGKLLSGLPLFIPRHSTRSEERGIVLFFGHTQKQLDALVKKEGIT